MTFNNKILLLIFMFSLGCFSQNKDFIIHNDSLIEVFTTRVDTIFGVTYLALAIDHPLVIKILDQEKILEFQNLNHIAAALEINTNRAEAARYRRGPAAVDRSGPRRSADRARRCRWCRRRARS